MQKLVGAILLVGIVTGIVMSLGSKTVVENNITPEVKVETVEVDATDARIKSAQAEAMSRIEQEANATRDAFIANELKEIEAAVLKEVEAEVKARRIEVEKTTGAY